MNQEDTYIQYSTQSKRPTIQLAAGHYAPAGHLNPDQAKASVQKA